MVKDGPEDRADDRKARRVWILCLCFRVALYSGNVDSVRLHHIDDDLAKDDDADVDRTAKD